jgi:hypothetical protein
MRLVRPPREEPRKKLYKGGLHTCSNCGVTDRWSDGWSYWGLWLEEEPCITSCSDTCRIELSKKMNLKKKSYSIDDGPLERPQTSEVLMQS